MARGFEGALCGSGSFLCFPYMRGRTYRFALSVPVSKVRSLANPALDMLEPGET